MKKQLSERIWDITEVKGKGKGLDTWYIAVYMRRLVDSSALQHWK